MASFFSDWMGQEQESACLIKLIYTIVFKNKTTVADKSLNKSTYFVSFEKIMRPSGRYSKINL